MKLTLSKKAAFAVAFILMPIGISFLVHYNLQKDFLHKLILDDFRMISSTDEARVQAFLEKSLQRAIDFSSDGLIRQLAKEIRAGNQNAPELLSAHLVQNKLPLNASLDAIHVLSLDGHVIASTKRSSLHKNFSTRDFFLKLKEGEYFSEIATSGRGTGLAASVYIAEPQSHAPIGIVTTFMNLSEFKIDNNSHVEVPGYRDIRRYIVNKDGRLVTGTSSAAELKRIDRIETAPVRACLNGGRIIAADYLDFAGNKVLGGSSCVKKLGWTLVAELDEKKAMAPVSSMLGSFVLVGVFTIVLIIGFSITFLTPLIRKVKSLSSKMANVAGGSYSIIESEGDDEVSELAESFNAMVRELKKRDDALIKGEIRYKMIHETLFDGVILADTDGKIVDCNMHVEGLLNYSPDELVGQNIERLFPKLPFSNSLKDPAEITTANKVIKKFEEEVVSKNGATLCVELAVSRFNVEGESYSSISMTDISEQNAVRTELTKTREKYRTLFLESKDMIFECALDGTLLETNPAGAAFLGHGSVSEALEVNSPLFSTTDIERMEKQIRVNGFTKNYEITLDNRDGKTLTGSVTAGPLLDGKGSLCGYRGIVHDITKLKRFEAHLMHSHKMEAIGKLAGEISHEFNNVLSIITGYATLLSSASLNVTEKMWLRNLLSTAEMAMHLTGGLLACSRKRPFSPKRLDLNSLVENFYKLLAEIIGSKFDFRASFQEYDIYVKADRIQLEQVLLNLVNNAKDAMPDGGVLSIKTRTEQVDPEMAELFCASGGDYAVIIIEDTGTGIGKKTLENIFDPFYTTKKIGEGTGFGLSIVYRIISDHKGFIRVESSLGKGTAFYLYLPLRDWFAAENFSLNEAAAIYL